METGKFYIGGMFCPNCQKKIRKKVCGLDGVKKASVSYKSGTADITYDASVISSETITEAIEELGYQILSGAHQQGGALRLVGLAVIIIGLFIILELFGVLNLLVPSKLADENVGYIMLFVIGLITSIHCIAMCGGINLSQCVPREGRCVEQKSRFTAFVPAVLYNLGRVISYTVIGAVLGLAGFIIGGSTGSGVSVTFQGILKLAAGVIMVIMGINMLNLLPFLRKIMPKMPKIIPDKTVEKLKGKGPLIVGLLNGFMPCGPLQSIQIIALASGNPLVGGLSMFMFSLGTVPLMLGFGSLVSALGKKFTKTVMTAGAVLIAVLGLAMFSQGWSLSGLPVVHFGEHYKDKNKDTDNIIIEDGVQIINSTLEAHAYPDITVKAGIPVKWTIKASSRNINGCNNKMQIPEYNIEHTFSEGDNIIEFTPTKTGKFQYSCWMGMIKATITVVK